MIGLFDSGAGGLTVLKALQERLPHESFFYLADTAHFPYGNKPPETILRYSLDNAAFLAAKGAKCVVIACNTASACALPALQQIYSFPVVGMIEGGVKATLEATKTRRVALLATETTLALGAYQQALYAACPSLICYPLASPALVQLVEERRHQEPATLSLVREVLAPLEGKGIDTLLLGCTHYPFLSPFFQEVLGKEVVLVDPAIACAEEVATRLAAMNPLL